MSTRQNHPSLGALAVSLLLFTADPALAQLASPPSPDADRIPIVRITCPTETLVFGDASAVQRDCDPNDASAVFRSCGVAPESDTPMSVGFSADGTKIIVANRDSHNVTVFDASTRAFLQEIAVSGLPNALAVSSNGIHVVTANLVSNTASILNLTTGLEQFVVPTGVNPGQVRISPNGTKAAVGNAIESTISIIDIATGTELRRLGPAGFAQTTTGAPEPGQITVEFSGFEFAGNDRIVHPDAFNHRIQVFNVNTGAVTTLTPANGPWAVAVSADGNTAAVSHWLSNRRISIINVPAATVTSTIITPVDLSGPIAIDPNATRAVVGILNACQVFNLTTGTLMADVPTASVYNLLRTADGQYVLCVGFNGSLITWTGALAKNLNQVVSTPVGAVSPAGPRAALLSNVFGEDLVVVNTNGAAGFLESYTRHGPPPEGDRTRTSAISNDGTRAVGVGIFSDSAAVFNADSATLLGVGSTGERPAEVAITPDKTKAVVCNLDSSFLSVVNMSTFVTTNVNISRRQSQVEISPDGQFAYVAVVADGDGVWKINLNTLSVVGGKLATGDMGGIGFSYSQTSGLTLSHNGATLVTCNSFANTASGQPDTISIIDTATMTVVKTVTVGDFPVRAIFSADDSRLYVSNANADTVSVVTNAGAASANVGTIAVGDQPFEMAVLPDHSKLYVMNWAAKTIGVVNVATLTQTSTIPLPDYPVGMALTPTGDCLLVSSGNTVYTIGPPNGFVVTESGQVTYINTATNALIGSAATGKGPSEFRLSGDGSRAVIPAPTGDGITLFTLNAPCPGDADGDGDVDQDDLDLVLFNFGTSQPPGTNGDLDGDGDVDQDDLDTALFYFGTSC